MRSVVLAVILASVLSACGGGGASAGADDVGVASGAGPGTGATPPQEGGAAGDDAGDDEAAQADDPPTQDEPPGNGDEAPPADEQGPPDDPPDDGNVDETPPTPPGPPQEIGQRFREVTFTAGLDGYSGPSYGTAWGDPNGDGHPDIWLTNHAQPPALLINDGAGGFTDATADWALADATGDMHGAVWVDVDADGREDLFIVCGAGSGFGEGPNLLYMNAGDHLVERAQPRGLVYAKGRGRSSNWLDWNGDGFLDVVVVNSNRDDGEDPTTLFTQQPDGTFIDQGAVVGLPTNIDGLSVMQWWDPVSNAPLLVFHSFPGVVATYQTGTLPWTRRSVLDDVSNTLTKQLLVSDLDGDTDEDFLMLSAAVASNVGAVSSSLLRAEIIARPGRRDRFVVRADGPITLSGVRPGPVRAGANEITPPAGPRDETVYLDPANPELHGLATAPADTRRALYVGYDTTSQTWTFVATTTPDSGQWILPFELAVDESQSLEVLEREFEVVVPRPDAVYLTDAGGVPRRTMVEGIGAETPCEGGATADFDNDGDMDVYLACRGSAVNRPNRYLEQVAVGVFVERPDAGARGTSLGRSGSVAVADYDGDGYLDILVANGEGRRPFNDGPVQLFRNTGGDNHWLVVTLRATQGHPQAFGARVRVTAQDGRQWVRRQRLSVGHFSQDDKRLHFGLGTNESISSIEVTWPSGRVEVITNVNVDQYVTVVEGESCARGEGGAPACPQADPAAP